MVTEAASRRFYESIGPLLAARDYRTLYGTLRSHWPPDCLCELLECPCTDVARTAVVCLGLTGSMAHCGNLAALLRNGDARMAQLAEDALWTIWLHAGTDAANAELALAVDRIKDDEYAVAEYRLGLLCTREPDFAEAFHQRGLALCLIERWNEAAAAYERAFALNPWHFAASAGLGHVCVNRGDVESALWHYRRAVQIHPGLREIREAISAIERDAQRRAAAG